MPLLLCDLDNTLIDRDSAFRAWATTFATRHGLPADETVASLTELDDDGYAPRETFVAGVACRYDVWDDVPRALAEYHAGIVAHQVRPPVSVFRALAALRAAGWRIAIVTNGDAQQQAAKIERVGLTYAVDATVISGAVGVRKPDAHIFQIAAERCRSDIVGGWMVGDDAEADIGGAVACGVQSIWLRRGRSWTSQGFRPTLQADSIGEAFDHLLKVATICSAHPTALRNSMATVVGPTPPTRGVIIEATSSTSSDTSGSRVRPR